MNTAYQSLYAGHVAQVQARWETALEGEGLQAALVHAGTPMDSFLDDYEYAFRPNPHFLHWLPLTRHADSALLIVPGLRPTLYYYQPDDYWYLPPEDPEPWWAEHFDVELVRTASGWREGLQHKLAGASFGLAEMAAIGDAPSLRGNPAELAVQFERMPTKRGLCRGLAKAGFEHHQHLALHIIHLSQNHSRNKKRQCKNEGGKLVFRRHAYNQSAYSTPSP